MVFRRHSCAYVDGKDRPVVGIGSDWSIFFVFGIIILVNGLKSADLKSVFLIFLYAGTATVVGGFMMQYGSKSLQEKFCILIPYIILSGFFLVGVLALFISGVRNNRNHSCTQMVNATCIAVKKKAVQRVESGEMGKRVKRLECPVFCFIYEGKTYEVSHNTYAMYCNARKGETYRIYINPKHPRCFRDESEEIQLDSTDRNIGVMLIGISIIGTILVKVLG